MRQIGRTIVWSGSKDSEVGKEKDSGIVRVKINPKYYRPAEVVSAVYRPAEVVSAVYGPAEVVSAVYRPAEVVSAVYPPAEVVSAVYRLAEMVSAVLIKMYRLKQVHPLK